MRTLGTDFSFDLTAVVRSLTLRGLTLGLLSIAVAAPAMQAQTAPYVLPYNMTTVAGPNAQYTVGANCTNSSLIALDVDGDGCLGLVASVGSDPHDVRVDYQGFVYIADDGGSNGVIHRLNPYTGQYAVYFNNAIPQTKSTCSNPVAGVTGNNGDGANGGCIASDLLSNTQTTFFTGVSGAIRGLGISPTNDVYSAFYSNSIVQKIAGPISGSASTLYGHLVVGVAGKSKSKNATTTTGTAGVYGTGLLNQARGVSAGPDGTVYITDSSDNNLRSVTPNPTNTSSGSMTGFLTAANPSTGTTLTTSGGTGVALSSATLNVPEDAQIDLYGNLFIVDQGDNLVRVVYHYAKASTTATQTSFFGLNVSTLTSGYIYTIAGTGFPPPVSSSCTAGATGNPNASAYAGFTFTNGISNSLPGTTVPIQVRKIGLDPQGNVYIGDNCAGVVYFVDAKTGGMHVVAGLYGTGQSTTPLASKLCASPTNGVGDGCPGTQASLYPTNMGVQPDTQGNVFITDSQGTGNPGLARIRKLTNGLNFAPTAVGTPVTQGVLMHFAANDTVAASNGFVVPSSDFSIVGTPSCTTNTATDKTSDCVAQLKFSPSQPGYQTSTLTVTSQAGGTVTYRISGIGTTAELAYDPGNTTQLSAAISGAQGVVVDGQGNAYTADTGNSRILLTTAAGSTTVLVPASTGLKNPKALALGTDGSLYIADTGNSLIRKFSNGVLTTIGGGGTVPASGSACFTTPFSSGALATDAFGDGCPAVNAKFSSPAGIATDYLGNVFVADTGNGLVRQIATNGYVSVLLTNFTASAGNSSPFSAPAGLALDAVNSNLIVADSTNNRVYSINLATTAAKPLTAPPSGIVTNPYTVVAGNGQPGTSIGSNGVAINSNLTSPTGVAVDASGNIYIADTGNNAIRMVTPVNGSNGGVISTIVGIVGPSSSGTGTLGGAAAITAYSYTTNTTTNVSTVTLTANNSFTAGTAVTFAGLTGATFLNNQSLSVQPGVTSTQFQVQYAGTIASPPPASGTETGTATSSSLATGTLLNAPGGVAVTPLGNLVVTDSGNNRLLYDSRSQVNYNFGRVNLATASTTQTFTAVNVGTAAATLNGLASTPTTTPFTLTGCSVSTLALGATCGLTGQFTPAVTGLQSATFTDSSASPTLPGNPAITLSGTGAQLTPTTISVLQTVPATGNPQYGAPITLQATVTAPTCNTSAPSCVPSGTVTFSIDGVAGQGVPTVAGTTSATATQSPTGLTVGPHTITCTFTPDSNNNSFYGVSSCPSSPALIVVVTQGSSTSVLSYSSGSNNQPQFTAVTLSVQVTSVPPSGVPTGTVTFYSDAARTNAIGTGPVSATTGIATLALFTTVDQNGTVLFNNTLLPGTYTLTCTYSGDTNYSASNCAGVSFTVIGDAPALPLNPKGCVPSSIYQPGTSVPLQSLPCPGAAFVPGTTPPVPIVSVGQGATTDVTLFVTPSNTASGTLSFSCSGLPANSVCTFSPQTLTLTPGTAYPQPLYTDVTLWTDIPPGVIPTKAEMKLPGRGGDGTMLALMLGWPLTLLGFVGLLRFRKRGQMRGLTLTALGLLMVGSALTLGGCAGPGIYHPNLTPVGTSVVTITVTGANATGTTTVNFTVAPGVTGQQ